MLFDAKLRSTGTFPRLDLRDVEALVGPAREQWAGLRFDRRGRVENPVTGAGEDGLVLRRGTHRRAGAVYELRLPVTPEADPERHVTRRLRERVRRTPTHRTVVLEVRRDDAVRFEATLRHPADRWRLDVDVSWADRLPRIDLSGVALLREVLRDDGAGCAAWLLRGPAELTATVIGERLASTATGRGASLAEVAATCRQGSATGSVDLDARRDTWDAVALARIRARGLARVPMLVARRRLRRSFADAQRSWWNRSVATAGDLRAELDALHRDIEAAGSPAAFLHAELWDPATRARRRARPGWG